MTTAGHGPSLRPIPFADYGLNQSRMAFQSGLLVAL